MNVMTANPAGCTGAGCECECHQGPSYPVFRKDPCPRCNLTPPVVSPSGTSLILDERNRQRTRWTDTNDDRWVGGDLVECARLILGDLMDENGEPLAGDNWPFQRACHVANKYGKDHVSRLKIAGALITAEIDRLIRAGGPREKI